MKIQAAIDKMNVEDAILNAKGTSEYKTTLLNAHNQVIRQTANVLSEIFNNPDSAQ